MDINGFRLTQRAQMALRLAQETAAELGQRIVGTEHLLAGLVRENGGIAARVLSNTGVNYDRIFGILKANRGSVSDYGNTIEFTPRSKNVLEQSVKEATQLGNNYVGTEHILLALLTEQEGYGAQILHDLGINSKELYQMIISSFTTDNPAAKKPEQQPGSDTPSLNQFGRDLTALAKEGSFDPVIGRDQEIDRVIQILSRRTKNNPCLIGEPGVGKTAIVEGLAQKIVEGNIPEILKGKRVVTLDLSSMVAGAKYRGEFEDRLKKAMEEVTKSKNVILFIDEMHTLIGAGAAEGAIDAANILKPSLSRGELQMIGATTLEEYRKYIEKDSALERRFQPIIVGEPTEEEALQILYGIRDKYEAHHKVTISDKALEAAVLLSSRYISDRFLPDKAIDLIDEAAAGMRLSSLTAPPNLKDMEDQISDLAKEKESAIMNQEYERAASLRDQEVTLKEKLEKKRSAWMNASEKQPLVVTEEHIAEKIASWTGIPVKRLNETDNQRLLHLEEELHRRVVGQDEAVSAIARAIKRSRVGLKDPKRPIGSFIFLGPTGVGKTELSKALADALFGSEDALIRVDMSEYMEKHNVSRLVGSPPGYVGYEDGGQLTEKVRRKPYSVILFDEIEKAHPDVFNVLLQIMDDGILTDSQGRKVNFKNTVIIMTSNIGARMITEEKRMGFGDQNDAEKNYESIKENVLAELKKAFRPEFLNRVDDMIVFHQLDKEHIAQIAELMLKNMANRLRENGARVTYTPKLVSYIAEQGFDITYGARPLRRAIQNKVEDKIAEEILEGNIAIDDKIKIDAKDGKVIVKKG